MPYKIRLRRDVSSDWISDNTYLDDGEAGYDKTNNKIKVGPGNWNNLPYLEASIVNELTAGENITIIENTNGSLTISSSGGGIPGGSNTQVQFNDNNSFGGDSGLTYNKTTDSLTVAGDLAVNGGDITTTQTTATVFNTNATTLSVGGAATTLSVGATTGTTTVNNNLTVSGDVYLDKDSVLVFEGASTNDAFETTLTVANPTADRTITLPNASGTIGLVPGSNGEVIINENNALSSNSNFTYNSTNEQLILVSDKAEPPLKLLESTNGVGFSVSVGTTGNPSRSGSIRFGNDAGTPNNNFLIGLASGIFYVQHGLLPGDNPTSLEIDPNNNLASFATNVVAQDIFGNNLQTTGQLQLLEDSGGNFISLEAPSSLSGDSSYVLPSSVGTQNQVLSIASVATNTATLQWSTPSSAASAPDFILYSFGII